MIVKKLLAPFLNSKILQQAEYCYIASAAISEPGFDMLMSKLSNTCKVDIVTGLDLPTNPKVLRKILADYKDQVTLRVYTRNFFHPKVYAFDLPYRKRIAFIGSGNFTMGGFQKNEELSYQIDTEKEVEEIKSWFNKYFEESLELTEKIIQEYEILYPLVKERENATRQEKKQFIDLVSGNFNWDNVDFDIQFFKRSDYQTFDNSKANLDTSEIRSERISVRAKFLDLHDILEPKLGRLGLNAHYDTEHIVSSIELINHHDNRIKAMWLAYGRGKNEIKRYNREARHMDFIRLQIIIHQQDVGIWLMPGKQGGSKEDREFFRSEMRNPKYRKDFFKTLNNLGAAYWIEVAGERRDANSFADENELLEFTRSDDWKHHYFIIGRNHFPDAIEISNEKIAETIFNEFQKLLPLYRLMKDKTFERN